MGDPAGLAAAKERMRSTWMAGDFGRIAEYNITSAEEFIDRLNIRAGMEVLDVACGTGNTSIPAAHIGAYVTGIDIATNLLEQARQRSHNEGVTASFEEGDAEELPYADAQYDFVITMFGAMFAPRPDRVAAELTRVCKPGGVVAMANWTPGGFTGKLFAVTARHVPPPEGVPPPVLWGDEETARKRLGHAASQIKTERRSIDMNFPFPPSEVVQLFRDYFGPTRVAFERLSTEGKDAYSADLERLWREHNEGKDGQTLVRNEYLEVIATRC